MSTIEIVVLAAYVIGGVAAVLWARHDGELRVSRSKALLIFFGWLLLVLVLSFLFYEWLTQ